MAIRYIDPSAVIDGAGSAQDPWRLTQVVDGNVGSGDALLFLNRTPASAHRINLTGKAGIRIATAPGEDDLYEHRAVSALPKSGWAQQSAPNDSVWALSLPSTFVVTVYQDYGDSAEQSALTGIRLRQGHLTNVSTVAACQATPGSWHYSSNTLYVHPVNSTSPNTDDSVYGYTSITSAQGVVRLSGCTDAVVEDLRISRSGIGFTNDIGLLITGSGAAIGSPTLRRLRLDDHAAALPV